MPPVRRSCAPLYDIESTLASKDSTKHMRYDPVYKKILAKAKTDLSTDDIATTTRSRPKAKASCSCQKADSYPAERNVFARRHAVIARGWELKRMKAKMQETLKKAEDEARKCDIAYRSTTREEMREKDKQILMKIAFETYERKWADMIYPEVVLPDSEEEIDDLEVGDSSDTTSYEDEIRRDFRFNDVPWPIFTSSRTIDEFLQYAHEIPPFLDHPLLKKHLHGVEDLLSFQRKMWDPRKIDSRIMMKIVDEDKEDVYKAYSKVKDLLWGELGVVQT